jgi:hypothetical protein
MNVPVARWPFAKNVSIMMIIMIVKREDKHYNSTMIPELKINNLTVLQTINLIWDAHIATLLTIKLGKMKATSNNANFAEIYLEHVLNAKMVKLERLSNNHFVIIYLI